MKIIRDSKILKSPFINIILFILTFISTMFAGLVQKGIDPLLILSSNFKYSRILEGLPFSITLLTILSSHELAHYAASKKNHTIATLPYFIPAPSIIGTFGAFIKMKSPIISRKSLIDIGASGPIAGFIVSFIATIIGLALSHIVSVSQATLGLKLGDSILFGIISRLIIGVPREGYDVMLHPIAFAGWIGFFVTSLNLLPIGQLDGGHISFAIFGSRQLIISRIMIAVLVIFGILYWRGWLVWGILLIILGHKHPPLVVWERPLNESRRLIAYISLVIFILTFIPMPFIIPD
ncbi:MAG: site-2 protease family protein [Nitrospirae bacterium]|nr:site-2 protease family protein [Nitrospirota bacterium]MBF0540552.1 site-2 protease family protein [Nitrospirota bacterium]